MRPVAIAMLALSLACAGFACWGMFTGAGSRNFDEMDGMIPFFAGIASGFLLFASALAWLLARRRG